MLESQSAPVSAPAARSAPAPAPAPVPAYFPPPVFDITSGLPPVAQPVPNAPNSFATAGKPAPPAPSAEPIPARNPFQEAKTVPSGLASAAVAATAAAAAVIGADASGKGGSGAKNWPPCYPLVRNAISEDVPAPYRFPVQLALVTYVVSVIASALNMITIFALVFSSDKPGDTDSGKSLGLLFGAIYLVTTVVCGWWWYKALYVGLAADSTSRICCFFVMAGFATLFFIIAAIGIPQTDMTGLLTAIDVTTNWVTPQHSRHGEIVCAAITTTLWGVAAILAAWMLAVGHAAYRQRGLDGYKTLAGDAVVAARDAAWQSAVDNPGTMAQPLV